MYTPEASPRDHLRVASALGSVFLQAREWHKAGLAYGSARDAFWLLFGQGLHDAGARDLIERAGPLFAEAAYAAAQRGELEAALALSNEGRALQLRAALRQQIELPADKRARHEGIKTELRALSRFLEVAKGAQALRALEQQTVLLQELGKLIAAAGDKDAAGGRALAAAGALLQHVGAIVVPVVTEPGSKLLLVTAGQDGPIIMAVDLQNLDSKGLDKLMRGDGTKVGAAGGWLGAYQINKLKGKAFEDRFREWTGAIEKVAPELWRLFGEALDRTLKERGIKPGTRIVMLPAGSLGLLPLGLAQEPGSGRRLGDTYEIVYAPSLDALAAASRQLVDAPTPSLTAVINPMGDLRFAEIEGKLVEAHFAKKTPSSNIIDKSSAGAEVVEAALEGRSYCHFASHGKFEPTDARESGLIVRDEETLKLGRLLDTKDKLGRARVAVLSACETPLPGGGRTL